MVVFVVTISVAKWYILHKFEELRGWATKFSWTIISLRLLCLMICSKEKFNTCGTVRHDRRGMPRDIGPKSLKMKRGDIATRVRGTLRAVRWKDRRDVYVLTNMHAPLLKEISPKNLARLSNLVL